MAKSNLWKTISAYSSRGRTHNDQEGAAAGGQSRELADHIFFSRKKHRKLTRNDARHETVKTPQAPRTFSNKAPHILKHL